MKYQFSSNHLFNFQKTGQDVESERKEDHIARSKEERI